MASSKELWDMLEALKELKAEYYIGSQAAFNYLKEMRLYRQLANEILVKNPDLQPRSLSVRRLVGLITSLCYSLARQLEQLSDQVSTPQHCSLGSDHMVLPSGFPHDDYYEDEDCLWFVSPGSFLASFLTGVPLEADIREKTDLMWKAVLPAWRRNVLSLQFQKTGEFVSYEMFCKEVKYRGGGWQQTWEYAESLLEDDDNELEEKDRLILRQACATQDLTVVHRIVKQDVMRSAGYGEGFLFVVSMINANPYYLRTECLLHDHNLYERAERELTLGCIGVERRILFNDVYRSLEYGLTHSHDSESVRTLIDELLVNWRDGIKRLSVEITRRQGRPDADTTAAVKRLQKRRYLYTALHQNRRWLVDFLSW